MTNIQFKQVMALRDQLDTYVANRASQKYQVLNARCYSLEELSYVNFGTYILNSLSVSK
jgi:hypothetical protein